MLATQLVLNERARQISLGYNPAHDASHTLGELSRAALARLIVADYRGTRVGLCDFDLLVQLVSPWDNGWPLLRQPRLTLLVEAAALLLAEIERLAPPPDPVTAAQDRTYASVAEAIGTFARATGNVGRIGDPAKRRKVLELLEDFADHLNKQVAVELAQLPVPVSERPTQEEA